MACNAVGTDGGFIVPDHLRPAIIDLMQIPFAFSICDAMRIATANAIAQKASDDFVALMTQEDDPQPDAIVEDRKIP